MNLTIPNLNDAVVEQFTPSQSCVDWCILQHVTNYNNIELTTVLFVAGALFLLYGAEYCNEKEKLKKYSPRMIYLAKLMIYIFFFVYLFVIRLRLYYYIGG